MRNKITIGNLTVQAVAGTHVVLLGMNMPVTKCPGVLGFAIRRYDHDEGETNWLRSYKTFASVEPHPGEGVSFATRQHPIQGFTWSDYSAKPDHDYTYEVIALRGTPGDPQEAETVPIHIRTECENGTTHHVHFNRGAAASQEYTRRFGDKSPDEVGDAAFKWLSRGAAEAINNFIGRAVDSGWGLRVGAYEFTDDKVLQSLKAAADRQADVQILYHAINDSQKKANETAITDAGLTAVCHPRHPKGLKLSHNKIMILTKGGAAQAVLTGSTNFSKPGIYGHSNVVHICEDPAIAARYLWLWDELFKNIAKKDDAPVLAQGSPVPTGAASAGTCDVFSPRPDLEALNWYAAQAKSASDALFMTFAFGMNPIFQDAYRSGQAKIRYALMEKMSGPTKTPEQKKANEAKIIALRKMEENKFAIGSYLDKGAFGHWLKESLSGLNVNVRYLHTKYMLINPLSEDPLVVSGSANFSDASTTDNDENMLIIRGDTRVADIYLGEFMRMYSHFAFCDWFNRHPKASEAKVNHLDETDTWWKGYFGTGFASRQRAYFAGD